MPELEMDAVIEANARAALDAILAELSDDMQPERVVYLVPGESVVWDECCQGQLTARVARLTPHRSSPRKPATLTPCSIDYWTVELEVMLLRCAAVVNNEGEAPAPDVLTNDGVRGLSDMRAMLKAVTVLDFVDDVVSWLSQGPSGGCFGNSWSITFKVDATPCTEETP